MKTCPICQQAYSGDVEFCARDGARLSGEAREERECPYCAERILKKARVCKHCGRDVEPLVRTDIAVQTPSPAPPERIVEPPTAPPQGSKPAAAATRPPAAANPPQFQIITEPPSKMKFVAIAVVALILIVAAVWYFSQHGVKAGDVRINPNDGLKCVWVPPGTFVMGCSQDDSECDPDEKPPHQVTVTKGFWMGQTEVTVGAYKRFTGGAGRQMPPEPALNGRPVSPGWSDETMPIVDVTWDDAQAYCSWAGGRLPTEAEWEYAARAGSPEALYGPIDEVAWYLANGGSKTHPVGEKRANEFGLYDMLGNVWEWVNDGYDESYYQNSPSQDPKGPTSGSLRVLRGGSESSYPRMVRASDRYRLERGVRGNDYGFRCVREVIAP